MPLFIEYLILMCITVILSFVVGILEIILSRVNKVKPVSYFGMSWICIGGYFLLGSLAVIEQNVQYYRFKALFLFPAILLYIAGDDYLSHKKLNLIRATAAWFFGTLTIAMMIGISDFTVLTENGIVYYVGTIYFEIFTRILILLFLLIFAHTKIEAFLNSPREIKISVVIMFIVAFIIGVSTIIYLYGTYGFLKIYLPLYRTIIIILILVSGLILMYRSRKILYILPFEANKLVAIKTQSGKLVYKYDWSESDIEDMLVSGMVSAIQQMAALVLKKGNIVNFALEQGTLTIKNSPKIIVGVLSSKASKFLSDCIQQFIVLFEKRFEKELEKQVYNISEFSSAEELIGDSFTFKTYI